MRHRKGNKLGDGSDGVVVQYTDTEVIAREAIEAEWEAGAENRRIQAARFITFDDFEDRFTPQEWDAATLYVYQSDTASGEPLRPKLVQGLQRAIARNQVDLLDAKTAQFLALLVTGNVIDDARKTEILTP